MESFPSHPLPSPLFLWWKESSPLEREAEGSFKTETSRLPPGRLLSAFLWRPAWKHKYVQVRSWGRGRNWERKGNCIVCSLYPWIQLTADRKYSEKDISRKFQKKQNLNLLSTANDLHCIYNVFTMIYLQCIYIYNVFTVIYIVRTTIYTTFTLYQVLEVT